MATGCNRQARADLESIRDYTVTHRGEPQAEVYTRNIQVACEALIEGTMVSRAAEEVRAGFRKVAAGSRVMFSYATECRGDHPHSAQQHGRRAASAASPFFAKLLLSGWERPSLRAPGSSVPGRPGSSLNRHFPAFAAVAHFSGFGMLAVRAGS